MALQVAALVEVQTAVVAVEMAYQQEEVEEEAIAVVQRVMVAAGIYNLLPSQHSRIVEPKKSKNLVFSFRYYLYNIFLGI